MRSNIARAVALALLIALALFTPPGPARALTLAQGDTPTCNAPVRCEFYSRMIVEFRRGRRPVVKWESCAECFDPCTGRRTISCS